VAILVPFMGHLVYFPRFGMLWHEKSGNPGDDKDQEVADFYRYQPPRKKS
jgi:hypothetical protein